MALTDGLFFADMCCDTFNCISKKVDVVLQYIVPGCSDTSFRCVQLWSDFLADFSTEHCFIQIGVHVMIAMKHRYLKIKYLDCQFGS